MVIRPLDPDDNKNGGSMAAVLTTNEMRLSCFAFAGNTYQPQ
jgi:hypothetical protein